MKSLFVVWYLQFCVLLPLPSNVRVASGLSIEAGVDEKGDIVTLNHIVGKSSGADMNRILHKDDHDKTLNSFPLQFDSSSSRFERFLQDETCTDDSSFTFTTWGETLRTCKWLQEGKSWKRQKQFCAKVYNGVRISDKCQQSCGFCSTCSYRCHKKWLIKSDVCEHDSVCSSCADTKPLHQTCKNLWEKCGDNDSVMYGGLDCSEINSLDQCFMQNIEDDYRETLVKTDWSWKEQPNELKYKHGPKENRFDWFLKRQPYEPIVNDETVIAGLLYTFSESTLKMSVYFPPLYPWESTKVYLEVVGETSTNTYLDECDIFPFIWMCTFRISDLPMDESYKYKVTYYPKVWNRDTVFDYQGLVPLQTGKPLIAALSCLGHRDTIDADSLVQGVLDSNPDVIVLLGDHNYFHHQVSYGFLETIYHINKITKSLPTIVQLDDHDYGLGNIFGAGINGTYNSGEGFIGSHPCLFMSYEQQALSHLPDPASSKTLLNGIKYRYTNYIYGEVDMAILEARKFKNREDTLLGQDQEDWLENWCNDSNLTRIVLTQTPFISIATHYRGHNKPKWTATNNKPGKDPNGFPPEARARALEILKDCSSLVVSGDQHLGFSVEYPEYNIMDCATPAAYNSVFWRINDNPLNGTYTDNHGNLFTLKEIYNIPLEIREMTPMSTTHTSPVIYRARGDGFLIVKLNGSHATCEMRGYGDPNNSKKSSEIIWKTDIAISSSN